MDCTITTHRQKQKAPRGTAVCGYRGRQDPIGKRWFQVTCRACLALRPPIKENRLERDHE